MCGGGGGRGGYGSVGVQSHFRAQPYCSFEVVLFRIMIIEQSLSWMAEVTPTPCRCRVNL